MRKIMLMSMIIFVVIATGCSGVFKDKGSVKFIDNGDGTVTDTVTGLIWQQAHTKRGWKAANTYCEDLDYANHHGWRLPNLQELRTIVDTTNSDLTIDSVAFPETKPMPYWSTTIFESNPRNAIIVDFSNGNHYSDEMAFMNYVRCVR